MAGLIHTHEPRSAQRPLGIALAAFAVIAVLGVAAAPARAAPEDQPAVDQYTDPFGPLGTGKRTPAWDPFSADFSGSVPAGLRRRLVRTGDGAALGLLLAQVETERARTRRESEGQPAAGEAGGTLSRGGERGALASAGNALFGGDSRGPLLIAGLVLIAVAATLAKRRGLPR